MPGSESQGGAKGAPDLLTYLWERFGIPASALSGYRILVKGSGYWIFSGDPQVVGAVERVDSAGILAARFKKGIIRPTTAFLRVIGGHAKKNVVELQSEREALEFMGGGIIRESFPVEPGCVIVKYRGDVLGCGIYSARLGLISQIPSHMRARSDWGLSASEE